MASVSRSKAPTKRYSFEDMHRRLFPNGPPKRKSLAELKEGIRRYIRKRHARS